MNNFKTNQQNTAKELLKEILNTDSTHQKKIKIEHLSRILLQKESEPKTNEPNGSFYNSTDSSFDRIDIDNLSVKQLLSLQGRAMTKLSNRITLISEVNYKEIK